MLIRLAVYRKIPDKIRNMQCNVNQQEFRMLQGIKNLLIKLLVSG